MIGGFVTIRQLSSRGVLVAVLLLVSAVLFGGVVPSVAHALPFISTGYGGWVWQNPLPQGNVLRAVKFVDGLHGWAVGDKGSIIATGDSGGHWLRQVSGSATDLRSVSFVDSLHGWAVGDSGTILVTADGGAIWSPQASGATVDLRSVCFVDSLRGWAVGYTYDNRTRETGPTFVLTTADGGVNWRTQALWDGGWDFNSVCFVDVLHGWVASGAGSVLATVDGGETWETRYVGSSLNPELSCVAFTDQQHGCAVGKDDAGYVIVRTLDGGDTWQEVFSKAGPQGFWRPGLRSVAFTDSSHGWAVGDVNALLTTSDGGATWTPHDFDGGFGGIRNADLFGVSAVDAQHVWSVAGNSEEWSTYPGEWSTGGIVLASSDSGTTWARQGSGPFQNFTDVAFADRKHGWAVGYDPMTRWVAIYRTVDGGATWIPGLRRHYNRPFQAVHCSDAKHAWAIHCSPGIGIIWRTSDGGRTWVYYARSGKWETQVGDLAFVDASRGWAVSGREIRSTTNGGKSWKALSSPTRHALLGVAFPDASHGWAVGAAGAVIATGNGGRSWRLQHSGTSKELTRVEFVGTKHGWAVGRAGTIVTTANGGRTWRAQHSGVEADLRDVSFVDARHGWIVGDGGKVLSTADGGTHWIAQVSPAASSLWGVDFVDATHGWAAGLFGTIIATTTGG